MEGGGGSSIATRVVLPLSLVVVVLAVATTTTTTTNLDTPLTSSPSISFPPSPPTPTPSARRLITCPAGFREHGDGTCRLPPTECEPNQSALGDGTCTQCPSGFVSSSTGCRLPTTECEDGYQPLGDGTCMQCPAGFRATEAGCRLPTTECAEGLQPTGDGVCIACPAGFMATPDGCRLPTTECAEGLQATGEGTCIACPAGFRAAPSGCVLPTTECIEGFAVGSGGTCFNASSAYTWEVSDWSTCSASCGLGVTTRTAVCREQSTGAAADDDAVCGPPPLLENGCRIKECVYTYGAQAWGACSVSCGAGIQRRSLTCLNQDGREEPLSKCGNIQDSPAEERACWAGHCSGTLHAWRTGDWGACSKQCGGGVQTRPVQCYSSDGAIVDDSVCAATAAARPDAQRVCNSGACETYSWTFAPYGECSAVCGGGTQYRIPYCLGSAGTVAPYAQCGAAVSDSELSRACALEACPRYQYRTTAWGACNAQCGGGTRERSVSCVDSLNNNAAVPLGFCTLPAPESSQTCNSAPCTVYGWAVSDWSACSATCDGTQTRTVACYNIGWRDFGPAAAASNCNADEQPLDSQVCNHNAPACTFCERLGNLTCGGRGVCSNGVCACSAQYSGTFCESSATCSGLVDKLGGCCETNVLTADGTCCTAAGAVLDANGACCDSGVLDACGVCNGPAKVVDVAGTCCNSVLDASGLCCISGRLDACGVCDGNGLCNQEVATTFDWPNGVVPIATDADLQDPMSAPRVRIEHLVVKDLADAFSVPTSNIVVDSMSCDEVDTGRRLRAHRARSLAKTYSAQVMVRPLQDSSEWASVMGPSVGVVPFTRATPVAVVPVCGNNICELQEQCDAQTPTAACCKEDCAVVASACPMASNGLVCGGHGRCVVSQNGPASGSSAECSCFVASGYVGAACDACAAGFLPLGGACVARVGPSCFDGLQNGAEAGIDCGGTCGSCGGAIINDDPLPVAPGGVDWPWWLVLLLIITPVLCCLCISICICCCRRAQKDREEEKDVVTPATVAPPVVVYKEVISGGETKEGDDYDDQNGGGGSYYDEEEVVMDGSYGNDVYIDDDGGPRAGSSASVNVTTSTYTRYEETTYMHEYDYDDDDDDDRPNGNGSSRLNGSNSAEGPSSPSALNHVNGNSFYGADRPLTQEDLQPETRDDDAERLGFYDADNDDNNGGGAMSTPPDRTGSRLSVMRSGGARSAVSTRSIDMHHTESYKSSVTRTAQPANASTRSLGGPRLSWTEVGEGDTAAVVATTTTTTVTEEDEVVEEEEEDVEETVEVTASASSRQLATRGSYSAPRTGSYRSRIAHN